MRQFTSGAFTGGSLAREEDATGQAIKEIEYMFYARTESLKPLLAAKEMMIQVQWGLWYEKGDASAASGSVRQRRNSFHMLTPDGKLTNVRQQAEFIMTTKVKTKDGHAIETSIPSTSDMFESFQYLADSGMVKHRYIFPIADSAPKHYYMPGDPNPIASIPSLKWEVDMFVVPGSDFREPKYLPWCKIDLEVPSLDTPIPAMPEGFFDGFDSKARDLTPEQQEIVKEMKQYLSLPNPHVKEVYKGILQPRGDV